MLGLLVTYDPDVDVLFVSFRERAPGELTGRTAELDGSRLVHYDAQGEPIAVEFLWASDGVELEGVPRAEDVAAAIAAVRHVAKPTLAAP